jgi:hypothetical protein
VAGVAYVQANKRVSNLEGETDLRQLSKSPSKIGASKIAGRPQAISGRISRSLSRSLGSELTSKNGKQVKSMNSQHLSRQSSRASRSGTKILANPRGVDLEEGSLSTVENV